MSAEDFVGVVEGSMAHCVQLIVIDWDDGLNIKCIVSHVTRISQSRRSRSAFCVNYACFSTKLHKSTESAIIVRVLWLFSRRIHGLQGRRHGRVSTSRCGEGPSRDRTNGQGCDP
ncbi:transcriptional regulator domain protein [Bifidobacterium pseudolongum]|nr:transcriptional regulator domain protein [Bifidobacterium pseudolongum]